MTETRLVIERPCPHAAYGPCLEGDFAPRCLGGSRTELDPKTSIKFRNGFMYFVSDVLDALVEVTE